MSTSLETIKNYPENPEIFPRREAREAVDFVEKYMGSITCRFLDEVESRQIKELNDPSEKAMGISFHVSDDVETETGWKPKTTYVYTTNHPFAEMNPEVAKAAEKLIKDTIAISRVNKDSGDPELTYLDIQRSKGGKKPTVVTQALISMDKGLGDWIRRLPSSEGIRAVADPYLDGGAVYLDENGEPYFEKNTKVMCALLGGSKDGRSVIEREAWEELMIHKYAQFLEGREGQDNSEKLKIASLGSGTGLSVMRAALAVLGSRGEVTVDGFDIDENALKIAEYYSSSLVSSGSELRFNPKLGNLLSRDFLRGAVSSSQADVYEAIGLAEYIPSEFATSNDEQKQREIMRRSGMISAEEFYGLVFENMRKGSIFLSGNMRNDCDQTDFVVDGLGWKGIIQRSTLDFLKILERAGIPGNCVEIYQPGKESGRVFNLVKITKE